MSIPLKRFRTAATLLMGVLMMAFTFQGAAFGQPKKDPKFMGLKVEGKRIALLFDLSASVVFKAKGSGMPLQKIMEQTDTLINSLPEDSEFALIQFVRNYKPFRPQMVPATKDNRDEAKAWMEVEWNESGMMPRGPGVISPDPNGFPAVLRAAYEMNPDVIFVISDGSFERGKGGVNEEVTEKEFEALFEEMAAAGKNVPINFIGFQMNKDDKSFWSRMTRKLGGDLKEAR